MWSPHDLGMGGGGRVDQLGLQAEGESLERLKGAGRLCREPF